MSDDAELPFADAARHRRRISRGSVDGGAPDSAQAKSGAFTAQTRRQPKPPAEFFECPRCAARFPTLAEFDSHRRTER